MSQLNVPFGLRAFRLSVRRWGYKGMISQVFTYDLCLKTALVGLYVGIIYLSVVSGALFDPFREIYDTSIGAWLMFIATVYSSVMLLVTLARVLLVMTYKPTPSLSDEELPTVSVIIPAYNEGPDVARSIESIARSNYPRQKLQIIAVDDGSKDDTWFHMDRMAKRYPDMVCAIRMDKNGGKRQGMRVGFALAAGDVVVTMDSDSEVERDALRNLVTPIAADPRVGSVAGNVKVLNRDAGILPRMMRASFVMAFDFTRAYQSQIRTVQCTPGAFSAYRRSAIEEVLKDWNNQTWMGKPSTIAEDRALSNLILRQGHEILFQSNAVVWTNVPTTYKTMAKMYQRWERGNLRENLTYASFCWKPFRKRFWLLANLDWALNAVEMVVPYILIAASLLYGIVNPFFALKFLAYIIIFSSVMQVYYLTRERNSDCIYGVLYSLFWFTCLWWVVPYSILTANNGSWMTRSLPSSQTSSTPALDTAAELWPGLQRQAA